MNDFNIAVWVGTQTLIQQKSGLDFLSIKRCRAWTKRSRDHRGGWFTAYQQLIFFRIKVRVQPTGTAAG